MKSLAKSIRNNLIVFSGEDYAIIRDCGFRIQAYFATIGLFVLTILLCCFLSAVYFTEHLFHNWLLDIGVGIIWGYIVTNLYVLLLYTISPVLIPTKQNETRRKTQTINFNISLILRIVLIVLLAIITTQPLNIFLLKPESTEFAKDIRELLSNNTVAWLVTIFVTALFLLPIYLKYSLRRWSDFYEKKAYIEKKIVSEEYIYLKSTYKFVLELNIDKYNQNVRNNLQPYLNQLKRQNTTTYQRYLEKINKELNAEPLEKYEYWADAPFRTASKSSRRQILSETDLLNLIYKTKN